MYTTTTEIEITSESISSTGETTTTEIETTSESISSTGETTRTKIETTSETEIETTEMVALTTIGMTSNSMKTILLDNRGDNTVTTAYLQGISTEAFSQAMTTQQPSTGHQYITVTQHASTCLYLNAVIIWLIIQRKKYSKRHKKLLVNLR